MIERLFDRECRYGEPGYGLALEEIISAKELLLGLLDNAGKEQMERLTDAYLRQENAMALGAFTEGFCIAAGLALDVREYLDANEKKNAAIYYNQEGLGEAPGAFPRPEGG